MKQEGKNHRRLKRPTMETEIRDKEQAKNDTK